MYGGDQTVNQTAIEETFCCSKRTFNPKFFKWVEEGWGHCVKKWEKTEEIADGIQSSTQPRKCSFSMLTCKKKT